MFFYAARNEFLHFACLLVDLDLFKYFSMSKNYNEFLVVYGANCYACKLQGNTLEERLPFTVKEKKCQSLIFLFESNNAPSTA